MPKGSPGATPTHGVVEQNGRVCPTLQTWRSAPVGVQPQHQWVCSHDLPIYIQENSQLASFPSHARPLHVFLPCLKPHLSPPPSRLLSCPFSWYHVPFLCSTSPSAFPHLSGGSFLAVFLLCQTLCNVESEEARQTSVLSALTAEKCGPHCQPSALPQWERAAGPKAVPPSHNSPPSESEGLAASPGRLPPSFPSMGVHPQSAP